MLFRKNKVEKKSYDKELLRPVIISNICTHEKIAGFKEIKTGKFHEEMLISNQKDLQEFLERYDLNEGIIIKE